MLPKLAERVRVPPIKCQGIKTKLVKFILGSIKWTSSGRWVEPFLGSGVVLYNLAPKSALVSDVNKHIILFYQEIQSGGITSALVRNSLGKEGRLLKERGESHYYELRDRFNSQGNPLDLLFLNRACFNGIMRFNQKGKFNVPFGHKPNRFRPAYLTKVVNQVKWVSEVMQGKQWTFVCQDWSKTLQECSPEDFAYLDPPYYGRHTDYYNQWSREDLIKLTNKCRNLPGGFALSMWNKNVFRSDELLWKLFGDMPILTFAHFYHVGPTEARRHAMEEALVIKPGYLSDDELVVQNVAQTTLN